MKKLAERLLPVTLLLAALVTACTTDEGTPAPNFPDPVEGPTLSISALTRSGW